MGAERTILMEGLIMAKKDTKAVKAAVMKEEMHDDHDHMHGDNCDCGSSHGCCDGGMCGSGHCGCPHHKVPGLLIVLAGLAWLAGVTGWVSMGAVNLALPILLVLFGLMKMFGGQCKCC